MTALRSKRNPRRRPTPRLTTEHVVGFVLGLALAAMAIDHGMRHPTNMLPRPVATTTGP